MKSPDLELEDARCVRARASIRALGAHSAKVAHVAHIATCPRCAAIVGHLLSREADDSSEPRRRGTTLPRRLVRIVAGFAPGARERLRDRLEALLVLRALRCVAAEDDPRAIDESLAREEAAAIAVETLLVELGVLRDAASDPATPAMTELRRFTRDFSDSSASYEALRQIEVLLPRPPRLPQPGDWHGRERVILWAASLRSRS